MWDSRYPVFVRMLSLFHVFLPIVLLYSLGRLGYDRRAWKFQSLLLAVLMIASRLFGPKLNLNNAFFDPVFRRAWGPAPVHLAVMFAAIVAIFYWPTHLVLVRLFPSTEGEESRA